MDREEQLGGQVEAAAGRARWKLGRLKEAREIRRAEGELFALKEEVGMRMAVLAGGWRACWWKRGGCGCKR